MKTKLKDFEIRSLKRKFRSQVIINRTSGGIATDLISILSEDGEVVSIFDGKSLTSKQLLREKLMNIQNGYILFLHLSDIPEGEDNDMIKSIIRVCIKGDWRNNDHVTFSEEWMNSLATKSVGVLILAENDEYKNSRDFKMMVGSGVCSYVAIGDNSKEIVE